MKAKTSIDPLRIFIQGYAFFQSQELIYSYSKSDTRTFNVLALPAVTMSAFASELFLKCLVCIETGTVPPGHNLRKLFDLSSSQSREKLCKLWDDYAPKRAEQWD